MSVKGTAAMQGEIDPALVERCVALVRRIAAEGFTFGDAWSACHAAQAIVAELPEPVDPDLIEARRLVAAREGYDANDRSRVIDGLEDTHPAVLNTLAAIKRGRQLEREGK